jgi:hypothetical protein
MRKLYTFFLLMTMHSAFCQEAEIPRKADICIISNALYAKDNYLMVKRSLSDHNIEIGSQDMEVFQIKSGLVPVKKLNGAVAYYIILCKDSTVMIKGMAKGGISLQLYGVKSEDNYEAIRNVGMKGSIDNIIFKSMVDFVGIFEHTSIKFEVSK